MYLVYGFGGLRKKGYPFRGSRSILFGARKGVPPFFVKCPSRVSWLSEALPP